METVEYVIEVVIGSLLMLTVMLCYRELMCKLAKLQKAIDELKEKK